MRDPCVAGGRTGLSRCQCAPPLTDHRIPIRIPAESPENKPSDSWEYLEAAAYEQGWRFVN